MSCQLVSAENESILWSTSVQVEPDQIGNSIDTACIELVNWLDGPRASTDTRGDIDSTAYTYWLRALALLDRGDPISFNVARAYLDDAVQRAPRSAVIHAYLALWYAQSALARRLPLSEAFASANQEADVALQLNSASAEAHLARAVVAFFRTLATRLKCISGGRWTCRLIMSRRTTGTLVFSHVTAGLNRRSPMRVALRFWTPFRAPYISMLESCFTPRVISMRRSLNQRRRWR